MAKKRKPTNSKPDKKKFVSAKCDDSEDDGGDKIYNDMDYLDFTEENDLVSKLGKKSNFKNSSKNELEELYALSGSSEDELPTINQKKKKKKGKHQDSDLDEETEGISDNLGAWGGKKQHFYGGNPNEKNVKTKGRPTEQGEEDDISEAEMEEVEAKMIQAKQLTELDEEDFLDTFASINEKDVDKDEKLDSIMSKTPKEFDSSVQLDLSKLSQKERTQLFHRESPEFIGILEDFELKLNEVSLKLYPISNLISTGKLPSEGPAADYIQIRLQTIMNYCTNIAAYLMFKTKRTDLKFHPITGQLVKYRKLLDQMEPIGKLMEPQIKKILKAIKVKPKDTNKNANLKRLKKLVRQEKENMQGNILKISSKSAESNNSLKTLKSKPKLSKKLKILNGDIPKDNDNLTVDEQKAIELYAATRKGKLTTATSDQEDIDDDTSEDNVKLNDAEQLEDKDMADFNGEEDERRGITYQIYKNQGLAPKRNKDQRNPRVKHRHKFEKAKVRRKGQVRTLRTETKRYSGEASGINMRVKKGVKIM